MIVWYPYKNNQMYRLLNQFVDPNSILVQIFTDQKVEKYSKIYQDIYIRSGKDSFW